MPHDVAVVRRPNFQNLYGPWLRFLISSRQLQQLADILLVARERKTKAQEDPGVLQQGFSGAIQILE
jgi:hypothetical protein